MKVKNSRAIVIGIISFLDVFINILNSVRTAENGMVLAVVCGLVLALCDMLLLFSIIEIADKPVIGMIMLSVSQLFTFIYELLDGATISEAATDMGITGIIVVTALIYHLVVAYKKVKENKEFIGTWKNKIFNIINYKRTIYNVKIYVRVIIYSLIVSAVMSLANSDMLNLMNTSASFKIYSAFVLVIPTMLILGIITTSYIAYDIFIVKIFFEIYTIYLLASVNNFDLIQITYIVIEIIAIMYAYFVTFRNSSKEVGDKNEKKK
jgi:hypothetical protein